MLEKRHVIELKHLSLSLLFLMAVASNLAIAGERLTPKRVDHVRRFFPEGRGLFAFLPDAISKTAANKTAHFDILKEDGAYRLPNQRKYWFILNHMGDTVKGATYLGVQIFNFVSKEPSRNIFVKRKGRWYRQSGVELLYDQDGVSKDAKLALDDFFRLHDPNDDLDALDKTLHFQWHGIPEGAERGLGLDSWLDRDRWVVTEDPDFDAISQKFFPPIARPFYIIQVAHLIRFIPSSKGDSTNRLIFFFTRPSENLVATYVRTFVPNYVEYTHEFFFTYKD